MRGLTARSMILSAFLGNGEPARVGDILSLGQMMGLQESAVRVALTRMVAAGDLERSEGDYRLSARLRERQVRQEEALSPPVHAWTGHWTMVVARSPGGSAADRSDLRDTLRRLRFRDLRDGVWTRPNNLDIALPAHIDDRVMTFMAIPVDSSIELAGKLFQPDAWAQSARQLLAAAAHTDVLAARFELAAAMIRHLLDDPLLPTELCPPDWPGARLRAGYDQFRQEFATLAEQHLGHPITSRRAATSSWLATS